ncbi:hypothetical protein [Methylobacterium sp. Leaf85]|uniref:hypothetical protein n=1 Tax=Methylobacterium sp. Leaf85 TaxID=1736241 RepID=UPI0006FD22BE|nr:hypothetical protein [Methylobacterium sp. Leaf85]KQO41111.1 hypothetical protein ASF08_15180 [Methylobacterium sp. Leaf85]
MSVMRSLTSVDESEYDRIEAAMSESERGRWFLAEYTRRNRSADTDMLLGAIARLESAVTADRPSDRETERVGRMRGDLMDMAHAIARTKAEIAAISTVDQDHSRLGIASVALDAIVRATERATSDILGAAEEVQETAWTMRESGADAEICDVLDRRATEIYTACSFQDLTAQRTARIIHTLRYLEERLAAMIAIWGGEVEPIPPAPGSTASNVAQDLDQSDVDRFIGMDSLRSEAQAASEVKPESAMPFTAPVETVDDEPQSAELPSLEVMAEAAEEDAFTEADPEESAHEESVLDESVLEIPTPEESAPEETDATDLNEVGFEDVESDEAKPAPEKTDIATAFADIDGLSEKEKLALFS